MGASFNRQSPYGAARDHPLSLRYRLLVHSGHADLGALNQAWDVFAGSPAYFIDPACGRELTVLKRGKADA
jgi:hypothetical protein